jgi:hypothetical protein
LVFPPLPSPPPSSILLRDWPSGRGRGVPIFFISPLSLSPPPVVYHTYSFPLPCNLSFIPQPRNSAANQKKSGPTNTRRRRLSSVPQIPHADTAWRHLWIWTPGSFFSGQMRNEGRQKRRLCFRSQTSPSPCAPPPPVFVTCVTSRPPPVSCVFLHAPPCLL